jgi:hypothetical protein
VARLLMYFDECPQVFGHLMTYALRQQGIALIVSNDKQPCFEPSLTLETFDRSKRTQ